MQGKNKYVRNLIIGAVTGGLIAGGATFNLNDRKPFIRDYMNTYEATIDTTIRTTEGLTKLNPTTQHLTNEELRDTNEVEVKSYSRVKDTYDIEVYGFTNGSLTDEEIDAKQNQFEDGNSLSSITNYDNHDKYQVEARELPANYENILEEINIKTINYDKVIKVRESRKTNILDTSLWLLIIAFGTTAGFICSNWANELYYTIKKKTK